MPTMDEIEKARTMIRAHMDPTAKNVSREELAWAYRVFADWFAESLVEPV